MRDVLHAIAEIATFDPQRPAITGPGATSMTYGDLDRAVAGMRGRLAGVPEGVGLLMRRSGAAIVADLALASLGRTVVPIPEFFSPIQWHHMIADAGIGTIVTETEFLDRLTGFPVQSIAIDQPGGVDLAAAPAVNPSGSRRIIYTSGTTGRPKGVLLDGTAMSASLSGLQQAVRADAADVHLSVLPFALLLEQLAGILLPLKVGARIHIVASIAEFPHEAELVRPTASILVPELLAGWTSYLGQSGRRAPDSLRFVAVGGAPVGVALAEAAWAAGIPVHEGYGLSECCSVVAVNRPGGRRAGTVGRVLDGVDVAIEDGEIVVRGPTVMTGYLGGTAPAGVWRTGDLGELDADGHLLVLGRRDDVVVTPAGRNVHPEWIEPMLLRDPKIRRAAVIAGGSGVKAALVVDGGTAAHWLLRAQALTQDAPGYARPTEIALISAEDSRSHDLFTPDGRPRRRRIAQLLSEVPMSFYETLVSVTTPERKAFLTIPLIRGAVAEGVDQETYLAFLNSAYHHVRHTVPLLRTALAACGPVDRALADGLEEYILEETGHDEWIVDDIVALGGDGAATRIARPPLPVRTMVAYAYHLIAEEGPYALLGMVHVLEGMSVALALKAADSIRSRLAPQGGGGFSYLASHGSLDVEHVDDFATLLGAVDTPQRRAVVIDACRDFYRLYGAIFSALDAGRGSDSHAA